ncbi:MAG: serine/threonine protein kinase [Haloferacaceae archaeon]
MTIHRRAVDPGEVDAGTAAVTPDDDYLLHYENARILVRDGREIVVDPSESEPGEIVRNLVVGPAFNHLLHQRDYFVLHASAVEIDGDAVAFAASSGQGKTTTATAFLKAGYRVLSDDVAAIDRVEEPAVRSGFPSMKLDPDVVERFDLPVDPPERTCEVRDRHFHGLRHDLPASPVPLRRIYLLEDGDREELRPTGPGKRVMELIGNTYTGTLHEESDYARRNFDRCASLAKAVPVKRLRRRRTIDALPEVVGMVAEDLGAQPATNLWGELP